MEAAPMVPVTELLATLVRLGAPLHATPEGRIAAPVGSSGRPGVAALLAEVRARKLDVMAELTRAEEAAPGPCITCSRPAENLFCFVCWQARRGRAPFTRDQRRRTLAAIAGKPCSSCGRTSWRELPAGDGACASCNPVEAIKAEAEPKVILDTNASS